MTATEETKVYSETRRGLDDVVIDVAVEDHEVVRPSVSVGAVLATRSVAITR